MFQNLYRWRFTSILLPYLAEDLLSFSTRHHVTRTRCLYGCLETSERGPYPLRWASRHCGFQVLISSSMLYCPSINSQCIKMSFLAKKSTSHYLEMVYCEILTNAWEWEIITYHVIHIRNLTWAESCCGVGGGVLYRMGPRFAFKYSQC